MMTYSRDALGGNPFYYTLDNGIFKYSYTLNGLSEEVGRKLSPDFKAMSDFLWHGMIASDHTMYQHICRLPPGHKITITENDFTVERYWKPELIKIDDAITFEEAIVKFRILFKKAVLDALPSDNTPIGCELSGGFDSSSVLCALRKEKPDLDIISLSMVFDEKTCDERQYINAVLKKCPVRNIQHNCSHLDYADQYNMTYNYTLSPHWPLWTTFTMYAPLVESIQKYHIRTVLTGQMGDHMLWGYPEYILNYLSRGKLLTFFNEWKVLPNCWKCLKRHIRRKIVENISTDHKKRIKKLLFREDNTTPATEQLPPVTFQEYDFDIDNTPLPSFQKQRIKEITGADFYWYIDSGLGYALKEKYGIEYKHPYADQALVEFMLSLPPEFLYSQGQRRFFHAEAMIGILPEEVLNRKDKAEFSTVILDQIAAINREALWESPSIVAMGIVDNETIERHEKLFISEELKGYDLQRYWRMLNLEHWYNLNPHIVKTNPNLFFKS